jgi:hypothetical protein
VASGADGSFILCSLDKATGKYLLRAGTAQGISAGSTFGVHLSNLVSDSRHSNLSLGTLSVTQVNAFTSELSIPPDGPSFEIPPKFYARIIQWGDRRIRIHSNNQSWLASVFTPEICLGLSVVTSDDPKTAHLHLLVDDEGQVHLERNDPMITPYIGSRFIHVIDRNNVGLLRQVVRCYAHFIYHLTRTGDDFKNVHMELRQLDVEYSKDFDQILTPVGKDLIQDEPATVVVDEDARLGMTIINQTDLPLYPYVFYFDPSDLVISEWVAVSLTLVSAKILYS